MDYSGKLSDLSPPSASSASEMSLVAGRTISHNIKNILTFLGAASIYAYERASVSILGLVEEWKFAQKLEDSDEKGEKLSKTEVPKIEVVADLDSEVCKMSGSNYVKIVHFPHTR